MNRREMLTAGFRHLLQAMPKLVGGRRLSNILAGSAAENAYPPEVLSFPPQGPEPELRGPQPLHEED